jgi:MOSC domain-containing protein YiiM
MLMSAHVVAVSTSAKHNFTKPTVLQVRLLAGLGVEGDAHCGVTVKHRSRVAQDPSQANLRQVHLLQAELFDELAQKGFALSAGQLGENITTRGVDLLGLAADSELHIGATAVVRITGLRNPCSQIERFQTGLMSAVLERSAHGKLLRKTGVMGVVVSAGDVFPGDSIDVQRPATPHRALECV